jgi:hypothetical protein
MASQRPPFVDYAIVALLLANLGLTAYSTFASHSREAETSKPKEAAVVVSDPQANSLATRVLALYNAKDTAGLYQSFDPLAKAQLTREQLSGQLDTLYPVMGKISDAAFSNAVLAGNDGGRDYYHLNYKVRLEGGAFTTGEMRITVTPRGTGFGIVGFFINGQTQQGRQ